jgi:uncharacterized RDD family membrane protein YckC
VDIPDPATDPRTTVTDPVSHEYAGIVSRTVAYLVDVLIVTACVSGTAAVLGLISVGLMAEPRDLVRAVLPFLVLLTPAFLALYSLLFWGLAGRTPGMALLGVRVVRMNGRPVGWLSSVVRAFLLAYVPVGAVWSVVDRRRQGLHDKVARTTVVRAARRPVRPVNTPVQPIAPETRQR